MSRQRTKRQQPGRLVPVLWLLLLLGSCANPSQTVIDAAMSGDPERIARAVIEEELRRRGLPTDLENMPAIIAALSRLLSDVWGEPEPEIASEKRYVKYSNAYEARAIVDFEQGWLRVETVAEDDPLDKLRSAIVSTLLTPRDMRIEEIFTDVAPQPGDEPFLLGQVRDSDGEAIRWQWRAERFADHLIASVLKRERYNGRELRSVQVDLVDDHLQLRELEFSSEVLAAARRYDISPTLVYAVIETESSFNPYAVSPAKAYGLMQVVPASAGRDVYERIKKQPGEPSRQQLFQPPFNVDIGTAYLHLLDTVYLARISDSRSRRFATIAAYNGGAGSALRAFDRDPSQALRRINAMSPEAVYQALIRDHPFAETRRYLEKVTAAERRYL